MAILTSVPPSPPRDTSPALTSAEREVMDICTKLDTSAAERVRALARRVEELETELNEEATKKASLEHKLAEGGREVSQARDHRGARHALAAVLGLSLQQLMIIGISNDPEQAALRELERVGWRRS